MTGHNPSWCLPNTIFSTEKSSHWKEMDRVYPWVLCGLTKMLETNGWLPNTSRSFLLGGEWGRIRIWGGDRAGSVRERQKVHRPSLLPTSLLILIHNLGFSVCSQRSPTNIPSLTASLTGLREWLNVTGPRVMAEIRTQVSWLTFIPLSLQWATLLFQVSIQVNSGHLSRLQARIQKARQSGPPFLVLKPNHALKWI